MPYWWVPDDKEIWVLAKQEGDILPNGCIKLTIVGTNRQVTQQPGVCMQTISNNEDTQNAPDDLISLPEVNQASILSCIRQRFREKKIYTAVGTVLMTVNPFERINGLYGPEMIQKYITPFSEKGPLPPHVYLVPSRAFSDMCRAGRDQSILISGESGAGKTEATKGCLAFLTAVSESKGAPRISSKSGKVVDIAGRIIAASPVLEAFGNAKTIRNPNSSRFGKWMELNFNKQNGLEGSTITSYLLEKSRVTRRDPEERNYHIFYQILRGMEFSQLGEWFLGKDTSKYRYLERPGMGEAPDLEDKSCFLETREAFQEMGFEESEILTIFRLVGATLHLGNIDFIETNGGESCTVSPNCQNVARAAELLRVPSKSLGEALTHKTTISPTMRRSIICMNLTPQAAIDTRDSLSRAIYDKLFVNIINSINAKSGCDPSRIENGRKIGLLDIFGFEIFVINSLEQLCINYCNEMLQNHFNFVIFTTEKALYADEGIVCDTIEFKDNLPIIQDVEKLFKALDEEAKVPKGSSKTWYEKMKKSGTANKGSMVLYPTRKDIFTVQHYAGNVDYQPLGFMEKNLEKLNDDLIECMMTSVDPLLQHLFNRSNDEDADEAKSPQKSAGAGASSGAAKKPQRSIAWKFQNQLTSLMTMLRQTESHFIRCIKSNDACKPMIFDAQLVHRQLLYSGVFEVVKIQQSGLPCRSTHREFVERFKSLAPSMIRYKIRSPQELIDIFKQHPYNFDLPQMQNGTTLVFFKGMEQRLIESHLAGHYRRNALRIQAFQRCHFRRKLYNSMMQWLDALHQHAHSINAKGTKDCFVEVEKFIGVFTFISKYPILNRMHVQHITLVDLVQKRENLVNLAITLVSRGDEASLREMAPIPTQAKDLAILHVPIIMKCCQMEADYRTAMKFIHDAATDMQLAEMSMEEIINGINAVKEFESILAAAPTTLSRAIKWKKEVENEMDNIFKPLMKLFEKAAVKFNGSNGRMIQANGSEADTLFRTFVASLKPQLFKCKDTRNAFEDCLIFLKLCDEALATSNGDLALTIINGYKPHFPVSIIQLDNFFKWGTLMSAAERLKKDLETGGISASAYGIEPAVVVAELLEHIVPLRQLSSPPDNVAMILAAAEAILQLRTYFRAKEWKQFEDYTYVVEAQIEKGMFSELECSAIEFDNCIWHTSYQNALSDLLFVCKDPSFQMLPTNASDWNVLIQNNEQAWLAVESASAFSTPLTSPIIESLLPIVKNIIELKQNMVDMNIDSSKALVNTLHAESSMSIARSLSFDNILSAELHACTVMISLVEAEDALNRAILKGQVQRYKISPAHANGVGISPTAKDLNICGKFEELKAAIDRIAGLVPDIGLPATIAKLMWIARRLLVGREALALPESAASVDWDLIGNEVNEIATSSTVDIEDQLIQVEVENIVNECKRRSILKQLVAILNARCITGTRCVDLKVNSSELRDCENLLMTCMNRLTAEFPDAPGNLIHLSRFVVGVVAIRRAFQRSVWSDLYDALSSLQGLLNDDGLAMPGIVEEIELIRSEYIARMELAEMREALVDLEPIIADDVPMNEKQSRIDRISDGMYLMTRLPGPEAEKLLEVAHLVRVLCVKIVEGNAITIPEDKVLEACDKYTELGLKSEEIKKLYKYVRLRQSLRTICEAMVNNPTSESIMETLDEIKTGVSIPQEMIPWFHCAESYGHVLQAIECRDWLIIVNRCRYLEEILAPLGTKPVFDPENEHRLIELATARMKEGYKLALDIKAREAELQITATVENVSINELMKRTLREEDEKNSNGITSMRNRGMTDQQIAEKNLPLNQMWAMDIPASLLRLKGISVLKMRSAGFSCCDLLVGGYSVEALGKAGYEGHMLRKSGATLAQLKEAGFSDAKILMAGYPIAELKEAGYDATKLAKLGIQPADMVTAGFTGKELRQAGFDALQLRQAGMCRVAYLRSSGFDLISLVAAGFDVVELREAGYDFESLREVGISDVKLLEAGFLEDISREVLLELFEATDGRHWKIRMNWGTNRPLREWYGVTAELFQHEQGRYVEQVVGLDLHDNNLSGEIPSRIGLLIHLRALSLAMNNLHGSVPIQLTQMKSLTFVDLSGNPLLREIDPNGKRRQPMPSSRPASSPTRPKGVGNTDVNLTGIGTPKTPPISREAKLKDQLESPNRDDATFGRTEQSLLLELYNATEGGHWKLKRNWCTATPLTQWFGLTVTRLDRIIKISLPMNNLQGEIPASIDCLTLLKELDLRYNQLCGPIPATIGNLTHLTQLHLHCNRLSGFIPDSITSLVKLEVLDLRSNQLTGMLPINLSQLTNLSYLAITSNFIKVPSKQAVRNKIPWCRIVIM